MNNIHNDSKNGKTQCFRNVHVFQNIDLSKLMNTNHE